MGSTLVNVISVFIKRSRKACSSLSPNENIYLYQVPHQTLDLLVS